MSIFGGPQKPKDPPLTPSLADSTVFQAGQNESGLTSMIATTPQGLTRKAFTSKRSLIGGS